MRLRFSQRLAHVAASRQRTVPMRLAGILTFIAWTLVPAQFQENQTLKIVKALSLKFFSDKSRALSSTRICFSYFPRTRYLKIFTPFNNFSLRTDVFLSNLFALGSKKDKNLGDAKTETAYQKTTP